MHQNRGMKQIDFRANRFIRRTKVCRHTEVELCGQGVGLHYVSRYRIITSIQ
jgi:hypothetical protein